MTKPVRSITIEFERMPGIPHRVMLAFWRGTINPSIIVPFMDGTFRFNAMAGCHPDDTFSWEVGMRLCVKRIGNRALYRAFRRWIWLKKAAHECRKHVKPRDCHKCPNYDKDLVCRTLYQPVWWATPNTFIAREFGRVKVRVE